MTDAAVTSGFPVADLRGRKVLVTGANRGLGRSFVEEALARGASAVVATARNPAGLPSLDESGRVIGEVLDVRRQETIDAVASRHPDVDLVISNAAVTHQGNVLSAVDEDLHLVYDTNVVGPLRVARAFQEGLRRPDAGMVFVLSIAAVTLSRSSPVYSSSKAAALMLTLAVGQELREAGTKVTAAFPGYIDTDMARNFTAHKAAPADVAAQILDGWAAGRPSIWPDTLAELVGGAIGAPFREFLDHPREAMVPVLTEFDRLTR